MALKTKDRLYFYRPIGYTEAVVYGVKMYRDASMKPNEWHPLPTSIDRLIGHLMIVTGHVKSETLLTALNIHASSVSRVRNEKENLPAEWLVRMADYSGLSLRDLREIGGIKPTMPRYNEYEYNFKAQLVAA